MRRTRTYDVDAASAGEALAQIADLLVEVESIRMLIQTRLEAVREYVDSRKGRRGHERLAETTPLLRGALAPLEPVLAHHTGESSSSISTPSATEAPVGYPGTSRWNGRGCVSN
jgi:hypothetical protein